MWHCRPGQPTIDMRHYKDVYAKCYNPQSATHLTSPTFDQYLSDLGTTFTEGNPLLLHAQCVPGYLLVTLIVGPDAMHLAMQLMHDEDEVPACMHTWH